ncbi:hypothetical protein B0T26DRAFT_31091 [Lasiosphaeria miniovina]|uniref:Uncharacterized protein n=1 Tax=Lasiosphaeria miniovina TaxID=1954250 RepID=A0AA40BG84_9PEZI|nr:uncharacterized protein B0T26DRAFT_31091 [Lasiosphaeria miniovina]KAK0733649.1 hypothetical protein B0T26DRAFT_31091 [Lasiosphaeria miniovina]
MTLRGLLLFLGHSMPTEGPRHAMRQHPEGARRHKIRNGKQFRTSRSCSIHAIGDDTMARK